MFHLIKKLIINNKFNTISFSISITFVAILFNQVLYSQEIKNNCIISEKQPTPIIVKNEIWIKANEGDPDAMAILGVRYMAGSQAPQNLKMAFYWINKAAKLNQKTAIKMLGLMYEFGMGTDIN